MFNSKIASLFKTISKICKVQTVLNFASSFLNMGKKVEICDLMVQQIDVNGVLILMLVMLLNYFVN